MADLQYRNLISFVREKPDNGDTTEKAATKQSSGLTGEEARSFYENIISQDTESESRGGRKPSNKLDDKGVHNKVKTVAGKCSKSSGRQIKEETPEQDTYDSPTPSKRSCLKECVATEQCHSLSVKSDTEGGYRLGMALLRCAEHSEKKEMKRHLENGVHVDFQDSYGWTALMCAAVAGQVRIVKHLLDTGADVSIVNNQQKNALQLAQGFRKTDVVDTLLHWRQSDKRRTKKDTCNTDCVKIEIFFCKVCDQEFSDCTETSHQSSTVHLFNLKLKPKPDPFMIPSSNVGFRLMKKAGWDGEKGLGPDGAGQKYPVKTVLKRDRACLGSEAEKERGKTARVTHFGPNDSTAVKSAHSCTRRIESAKTLSRRAILKKEKRDKEWERNLRQYMNTD